MNFGTAKTLAPHKVGFAAGMGGQVVVVGEPKQTSAFFFIPHAGLRVGLTERFDAGWRLAPVPLPFSTVGPGFGANLDGKFRVTDANARVHVALIAGAGFAHVLLRDTNRYAWSPNGAVVLTLPAGEKWAVTTMARYVYLGIPSAAGGAQENHVHITGTSLGLKWDMLPNVAVLPEIGTYWYEGKIGDVRTSGPGFQYGIMLATSF